MIKMKQIFIAKKFFNNLLNYLIIIPIKKYFYLVQNSFSIPVTYYINADDKSNTLSYT